MSKSHVITIPQKIGKYAIQGELGRGTCGVVYKAFDPFINRDVAIKVAVSDSQANVEKTRQLQRTFFTEAHAAGRLQHPHIVAVYDAGVENELNYIVMEYISGKTLLEYCRRDGKRLGTEQVIECIFKCSKALDFSHRMGVIHRDIKPSNIMLSKSGETKIMDFSIAEITQTLTFTPMEVVGSPSYMAPEQVLKEQVGAPADLYSLGAVMYQLLTGERPFMGDDIQKVFRDIIYKSAPLLKDKRPDLPVVLSDLIEKLLSKNPQARFQSGRELAAELTTVFDNLRYAEKRIARKENRSTIQHLNFFNEFTDSEIDEILNASSMIRFDIGDMIIKEGEIDNSFYIIAVGEAEVRKGNRKIVTLHVGDCFGEIGFLMAGKRTASIVAASEVLVLKVSASLMEQVSKECQLRYYKAFNETLIYRLAVTSARLSAISSISDNKNEPNAT